MKKITFLFLFVFFFSSCTKKIYGPNLDNPLMESSQSGEKISKSYAENLSKWRAKRLASITAPQGWLSVVGLHWLKDGENTFGSSPENDFVFDEKAAGQIGSLTLERGRLNFKGAEESSISIGENNYFLQGLVESDAKGPATIMNHRSFFCHVIKRGNKYGLRVKDTLSENRMNFEGIPNYPINTNMIIDGKVIHTELGDSIDIQNVLGQIKTYQLKAIIQFEHQGEIQKLHAIDGGEKYYYIIFSDATTGIDTYGGGRFLYVDKPKTGKDKVIIDFNKAENPPCVFTDFATCPLPPDRNKLSFLVEAGEKKLKTH